MKLHFNKNWINKFDKNEPEFDISAGFISESEIEEEKHMNVFLDNERGEDKK